MFVPLYIKSNYSLLSSLLTIDDIITWCVNNNIPACAINDNNMYAVMEFITKCKKNNIKPIISISLTIDDKEVLLYAKNLTGYKALIKLSTIMSERALTLSDLSSHNQDLICIIPYKYISSYKYLSTIYDDLYLGYTTLSEQEEVLKITKNIVFAREMLYLNKEDSKYLKYLLLIRDSKTINDNTSYDLVGHEVNTNIKNKEDIGILNTFKIMDKCQVEFSEKESLLPIYKDTKNISSDEYLINLSKVGLKKRLGDKVGLNYQNRLKYELDTIISMGFCNYFLVVYDFIKYAKKNNILVGPGRGSAAGSLVSYCLGITDIDPIKYDLVFERFLNPERKTMPDIDTDFPDDKRGEVIEYVREKYGHKNVAGIITFGTLGLKQVIRDTCRVLAIPLYKVDSLLKPIPNFTKDTLTVLYQNNEVFKSKIDSDSKLTEMFDIAKKIEGFPRHTSSHAAGIIMCRKPLDEVIPLTFSDGEYLSSYSMEYLEDLGLLKMDFLGLKNLSIISNIISEVNKNHKEQISFSNIPLDDKKTIEVFQKADTLGVFQFESAGMRNFLLKLKPDNFEDIFAAIALFRPGPATNIDSYIRRKKSLEKIDYIDDSIKDILKSTYGILIYQEQIIQVANKFAGYSLGEADVLRRAMSKKKLELLKNEEEKFIKKSLELGREINTAKKIFSLILNFAGYGFNRSHSVAYSIIAYKMAYLRVYYKEEFYASLLSSVIGSDTKTKEYIDVAKEKGVAIQKPSINISRDKYIVNEGKIVFPLSCIKSIGSVIVKEILEARSDKFKDIYDAFSRLSIAGVNKKALENLIYSDCFKEFGFNRKTLIMNLDALLNYAELTKDLDPSLVMKPEIIIHEEFSDQELLGIEKDIFGFYLSYHPTTNYQSSNKDVIKVNQVSNYFNKNISLLIYIEKIKVINTKKNEKMAFVMGSDEVGSIDITLFPDIYKTYANLVVGDIIKIVGNVEKRYDTFQVIAKRIDKLN